MLQATYHISCSSYYQLAEGMIWPFAVEKPVYMLTKVWDPNNNNNLLSVFTGAGTTTTKSSEAKTDYDAKVENFLEKITSGWVEIRKSYLLSFLL